MKRFDVLAVGELNPDFILAGITADAPHLGVEQEFERHHLTLGSSTAITCVLMQRLGLNTAMSACVGDDDHGRFCRAALDEAGVDTAMVTVVPDVPTGLTVCLPYPHDRLLLTAKGTMTLNPALAITPDILRASRHLHVGSYFLQTGLRLVLADLFATARRLGLSTSLDTGWDPDERWLSEDLRAVLARTSCFFPNEVEFEKLTGTADPAVGGAALRALGVETVVLKRGARGAVAIGAEGLAEHVGYSVKPIDTTGAGDAFNAGYLAAMFGGEPVAGRLAFGNACGALTVSAIGGTGGVASRDQVLAFGA